MLLPLPGLSKHHDCFLPLGALSLSLTPPPSLSLSLRQGLSLASGICLPLTPQHCDYKSRAPHPAFIWTLGTELGSPWLLWHFTNQATRLYFRFLLLYNVCNMKCTILTVFPGHENKTRLGNHLCPEQIQNPKLELSGHITHNSSLSPTSIATTPFSASMSFRSVRKVESYNIRHFVSGLFHLPQCLHGASMLYYVSNAIPLSGTIPFVCWWKLRLCLPVGYCKWSYCEH